MIMQQRQDCTKERMFGMKFLLKYNLELLTLIMVAMIVCAVIFVPELTLVQKFMLAYMLLYTAHEWEETRFPGGFSKLMAKFFGLDVTKEKEELSHIPVAVLLIAITFLPFFWQNDIIALIPVYLGIFEALVHVVGIKLHKMSKPYTPGMITALALLLMSICALATFAKYDVSVGRDFALGLLCMFVCFAAMQRTVIAIFGLGYRDIIAKAKSKFKH